MIKQITMPAGGQTTDTSIVGRWLVKKGDTVKRGDPLLEVETDKAVLTVESFAAGTVLELLAEEGDAKAAGDVIALIGNEGDLPGEAPSPDAATQDEYQPICPAPAALETPIPAKASGEKCPRAMPNAKLLAKEHGLDLARVGAALGKEVLKKADVSAYLAQQGNAGDTLIPLTPMRKTIARRMAQSAATIPVFRVSMDMNMTRMTALRARINAGGGPKISYNDLLFLCIAGALKKYPNVNASFEETHLRLHGAVHIGLAVSVEGGLVVPVVRDVADKGLGQISAQNRENIQKAREGKLTAQDMTGGTITLSNLGMYPVKQFDAIINPPEACILAVGAIAERPVREGDVWKAVPTMTVTASFDHRVVDGAYGAAFLAELCRLAADPALLLM